MNEDACLIIPVFNEAAVVRQVVKDALALFPHVVCVDDGSTDGTADELAGTGAIVVQHPLNLGQGAAIQTGVEMALRLRPPVRFFVTFDADGQHRLADLDALLAPVRADAADIVFGSRFLDARTELTPLKRAVLRTAVRVTNATSGVRLTDAHNGLRAFNRDVASRLQLRMNGMAHATEIVDFVAAQKLRHVEVPVQILYSEHSRAKGQPILNAVNIVFDLILR